MIYRVIKSIRAHPRAWAFALGTVAVALPLYWRIVGMFASFAVYKAGADANVPPSDFQGLWLRLFRATDGPPFSYLFEASLAIAPVMVSIAAFLVVRRYCRIRERRERPTVEFWIAATLTVVAVLAILGGEVFLYWPAPIRH